MAGEACGRPGAPPAEVSLALTSAPARRKIERTVLWRGVRIGRVRVYGPASVFRSQRYSAVAGVA